jgi:hypothetical protein
MKSPVLRFGDQVLAGMGCDACKCPRWIHPIGSARLAPLTCTGEGCQPVEVLAGVKRGIAALRRSELGNSTRVVGANQTEKSAHQTYPRATTFFARNSMVVAGKFRYQDVREKLFKKRCWISRQSLLYRLNRDKKGV